ncbi:hypothetical protein AMTR_s00016p00207920 [Amborella trichopoda]|uniref:Uncharacterized protein n=1 Tax=Amborella trichopoda TaxID=13333 RepID=W1PF64_AMBTC|nr:hypothetical protein AMTR_s00016p00207920 [Amborella trichopoda]
MINSMCGSLGTPPKTENLSPTASVADSNTLFDFVSTDQPTTTSPSTLQNSNKFDSDFEIHSPDSSIWESLFADHLDQVVGSPDFMICSPKRVPTGSGGPDHFGSPIHPSEFYSQRTSQSCSVPCTASQLMGAFSSSSMPKAKPVIQTVQQPESPALPSLLGYGLDEEGSITGGFVQGHAGTAGKLSHLADVGYGSQCSSFDCGPATGSRPRSRGSHELYMSGNNGGGGGGGGGGSNVYSHTTLPLQGLERGGVSNSLQVKIS